LDGHTLVAGRSGAVGIYAPQPLAFGQELAVNEAEIPILSAGLSPDGGLLVACDAITRTALFDLGTGATHSVTSAGKAIAVRWSSDGTVCALVALTQLVGFVDRTGRTLRHVTPPGDGTYYFVGGGWTADGTRFVVGTEHGRVFCWSS